MNGRSLGHVEIRSLMFIRDPLTLKDRASIQVKVGAVDTEKQNYLAGNHGDPKNPISVRQTLREAQQAVLGFTINSNTLQQSAMRM